MEVSDRLNILLKYVNNSLAHKFIYEQFAILSSFLNLNLFFFFAEPFPWNL